MKPTKIAEVVKKTTDVTLRDFMVYISSSAAFYRNYPDFTNPLSRSNPKLFGNLELKIQPPRDSTKSKDTQTVWGIIGPSGAGKTTLLQIVRGQHICLPPRKRSYGFLEYHPDPNVRNLNRAIQYVGFSGEEGFGRGMPQSAYLSSRYESRREDTDFTVLDYLKNETELNPLQDIGLGRVEESDLQQAVENMRLRELVDRPVTALSNGQTRRMRIARALLAKPKLLLLDEPFMGLDPMSVGRLSEVLGQLTRKGEAEVLMALRPQDPVPAWVNHLHYIEDCRKVFSGAKEDVLEKLEKRAWRESDRSVLVGNSSDIGKTSQLARSSDSPSERVYEENKLAQSSSLLTEATELPEETEKSTSQETTSEQKIEKEPLVEMEGVQVAYGSTTPILGNWSVQDGSNTRKGLWWTVRRGDRWAVFGPNGSGKTTILSLVSSDHPQTYSLPIRIFGKSRIPEPGQRGVSIFDIQSRIGHASPEVHSLIPKSMTIRKVLVSAWSPTIRERADPNVVDSKRVDAFLRHFEPELRPGSAANGDEHWTNTTLFGGSSFSSQKVLLFLRALIKQPDVVILDEAFSGMDTRLREKCMSFLRSGAGDVFDGLLERQALICVSHLREEIPGVCRNWICLPESETGKPARFGKLKGGEVGAEEWKQIWGVEKL